MNRQIDDRSDARRVYFGSDTVHGHPRPMSIHRRRLAFLDVGALGEFRKRALLEATIMDQSHEDGSISASEFDIAREALRRSIVETKID